MKTNKGTGKDGETKTPRITFSVSKEFESILPEIDSMPNMSRFVCEAIHEKLQRVKNPNKDLQEALSHFVQIQQVIGGQQAPTANQSGAPMETFQNTYGTPSTPPPPVQRAEQRTEEEPEKQEEPLQSNDVEVESPDVPVQKETSTAPSVNEKQENEKEPVKEPVKEESKDEPAIETEEEDEVLNELQKNFLKPRTSR